MSKDSASYRPIIKARLEKLEEALTSGGNVNLFTHAFANTPAPLPPPLSHSYTESSDTITNLSQTDEGFLPLSLSLDDVQTHLQRMEYIVKDEGRQKILRSGLELFIHGAKRGKGSRPRVKTAVESQGSTVSSSTAATAAIAIPVQPSSSRSSSSSTSGSSRDSNASQSARSREGERCLLTRSAVKVAAAHIIPYHVGRLESSAHSGSKAEFWEMIRLYCGEKYYRWLQDYLLSPSEDHTAPINRLENLVSLEANVHGLYDDALVSFEPIFPIPAGASSYTIRVHFNPRHKRSTLPLLRLSDDLEFLPLDEDKSLEDIWLQRKVESNRREEIVNGYVFRIRTSDPISKPLPNPHLLLLHHHLSILCRCCGMGMIDDEFWSGTDDDVEETVLGAQEIEQRGQKVGYSDIGGCYSDHEDRELDMGLKTRGIAAVNGHQGSIVC